MPRAPFLRLPAEQRAVILSKAGEMFADQGFAASSYNQLIREMGLSKGAMYYYFEDKKDLFRAAVEDVTEAVIERVGSPPTRSDAAEFWEEVMGMYMRLLAFFREEPARARLFWRMVHTGGSEQAHPVFQEQQRRVMEWVTLTVRAGQRSGAVRVDRPAGLLAHVAFSMVDGMATWLGAQKEGPLLESHNQEQAQLLLELFQRAGEPLSEVRSPRSSVSA